MFLEKSFIYIIEILNIFHKKLFVAERPVRQLKMQENIKYTLQKNLYPHYLIESTFE